MLENKSKWLSGKVALWLSSGLIMLCVCTGINASSSIQQQRQLFRQAEKALAFNDLSLFNELTSQLQDYPVVAYLKYDAFKAGLKKAEVDEVSRFLEQYKDYPFNYHLRSRWLNILATRKDWSNYLVFYDERNETKYKCLALTAKLQTGQTKDINQQIKKLWLTGYSQPAQCDAPFKHFLQTYEQINDSIWLRIEKAFNARRPSLAKYLGKKLNEKDRQIVDKWYQAHRNPADSLPALTRSIDSKMNRKILIHALDRLARTDSLEAKKQWDGIQQKFTFNSTQIQQIDKRIALSAAYQHKAESKQLLEQLPSHLKSDNAYLWLARIHLRDEDWIGLVKTINAMPAHLKKETEWVYWLARGYDEAGHQVKASEIYNSLSEKSTYYGFLAADKIDKEYRIKQQQVTGSGPFDEQQILDKSAHLLRARELFYLDRLVEARREWFQGVRKLNTDEIKQAARMASIWKWHDNAIKTVAKTSHRNDYDLRFPMPYQQLVMNNIKLNDLDPSVIYGVMRRESLFDPLAKSRVGALGLMQLMPYTARRVAKSLGLKRPGQADILNIDYNIKLGTKYFKTVLNQFDDNVSLAAAAYNAGPKNVKKWLPEKQALAADLWVETVPFKETRNYIQAVLAYATIFDKQLGKQLQISSRMADVKPDY